MEYDRIHHYYSVAIESDACGTVIIGLGWLVLSQVGVVRQDKRKKHAVVILKIPRQACNK
eukprot:2514420-Amphidinium_carterae.1